MGILISFIMQQCLFALLISVFEGSQISMLLKQFLCDI